MRTFTLTVFHLLKNGIITTQRMKFSHHCIVKEVSIGSYEVIKCQNKWFDQSERKNLMRLVREAWAHQGNGVPRDQGKSIIPLCSSPFLSDVECVIQLQIAFVVIIKKLKEETTNTIKWCNISHLTKGNYICTCTKFISSCPESVTTEFNGGVKQQQEKEFGGRAL